MSVRMRMKTKKSVAKQHLFVFRNSPLSILTLKKLMKQTIRASLSVREEGNKKADEKIISFFIGTSRRKLIELFKGYENVLCALTKIFNHCIKYSR